MSFYYQFPLIEDEVDNVSLLKSKIVMMFVIRTKRGRISQAFVTDDESSVIWCNYILSDALKGVFFGSYSFVFDDTKKYLCFYLYNFQ